MDSTSARAYGGLGLGLAIVRELVELHQGTIEVESPGEGQGTTFTVCLPDAPAERRSPAKADAEAEVSLRGLRILLVDDEPNTREVTSAVLQSFGAEVAEAGSASEALTLLQGFEPDILVSDIAMPLEDGYYLIGKVRALQSRLAQIPALALTAYAGERDILRAHQAGFDSHAAKPVDAHKLALAIATLAGRGAFLIPRNSPARQSLAGR